MWQCAKPCERSVVGMHTQFGRWRCDTSCQHAVVHRDDSRTMGREWKEAPWPLILWHKTVSFSRRRIRGLSCGSMWDQGCWSTRTCLVVSPGLPRSDNVGSWCLRSMQILRCKAPRPAGGALGLLGNRQNDSEN